MFFLSAEVVLFPSACCGAFSLLGFINILVLATIFLSPLLVDQKSLKEAAKRQEEIQRQGEQLKRRYYETRSYEDFKAWWDWCVKYNNGWWN